jgi:3-hydroxyacyl-CoA dehydrogenase
MPRGTAVAPDVKKVVVLGANGTMGSGSGAVFAGAGIPTVFLARTSDKAREGQRRAEKLAKSTAISRFITVGSYDEDLARQVADADLIFEAVFEDVALKKTFFDRIEEARRPDAIVATVTSGLSIAGLAAGRSPSFARNFLGIHFFNPPNVIIGCEMIPHAGTDPAVTAYVDALLRGRLSRELVRTSDTPAFCGNRVGFKVLNECAQLAERHGVATIDFLIGPHTGRAMAPLATIDFVGWDVHQAIVRNLRDHTKDEAHDAFLLPPYMARLIERGHLGRKTPALGGFTRRGAKGTPVERETLVLDPATGEYAAPGAAAPSELVRRMKAFHRVGRYREAFDAFAEASGEDARIMRQVILGYVSYGLSRVGEVVERAADVDRIMSFGFNWAPTAVIVDLLGARRAVKLMEQARLPVPRVVIDAAERNQRLYDTPHVDIGRFFHA